MSLAFHPLRIAEVRPEADDALVLQFEVPPSLTDIFRFAPGQHLTLRAVVDGVELRRSYSVCAGPGEPLRVGVRRVAGGAFSTWLHGHAQRGLSIDVMPPEGRFGAALARRPRHLLAVAGGSGITPILSLLKAQLASDARARATLVYANRRLASTMFREELDDLKNRHMDRLVVHPVFSREPTDVPLQSGRLDGERLATLLRLLPPVDEAFVCGPHAMNDEVEAALRAAGLPAAQVHVERFGVPPAQAQAVPAQAAAHDPALARVSVLRDGLVREVPVRAGDASILAAAAAAGLDLPFSCTSGVCATCRCKVLEGEVRMDRNFALEPADVAAGFVLACQAHPLTERVRLSFDDR